MTIRVFYSCFMCGLTKIGVDVPVRGDEDVKAWMDATMMLLGNDHFKRRPTCPTDGSLKDILIPITGATKVGGPTMQ